MVVSANHFKDVTNGYERRTDGLWVHGGRLSVGPPGSIQGALAGDLNVSRGDGTGAIYFGGFAGGKYVANTGAAWVFSPPLTGAAIADGSIGTADLAPGAASALIGLFFGATGFTTTAVSTNVLTPITTGSVACSGAQCRIEFSSTLYHSAPGAAYYTGLAVDGVVLYNLSVTHQTSANYTMPIAWVVYFTPAAGNHTFTASVVSVQAGTLGFNTNIYSGLFVTEQRR